MISLKKIFYALFVLMLVAGLFFYQLVFQFVDELLVLLLALLCMVDILGNRTHRYYKGLFLIVGIMTFYLVYSIFALHYNTASAIAYDYFIQLKPFIAFYVAYALGVEFTAGQKNFLKKLCVALSITMLVIILSGFGEDFFFHVAYYGIISTIFFLIYYYCSYEQLSRKDMIIMFLMLTVGLFSTRSKFYGFYVAAPYIILLYKPGVLSQMRWQQWIMIPLVVAGMLYVAWGKINFYFISSGFWSGVDSSMNESFARAGLYMQAPLVIKDHFLLGSGLASYATYASGEVGYSQLYQHYGLDEVWGLLEGDCPFVSDTFFPELAQFGVVGIILFVCFWVWIYKKLSCGEHYDASMVHLRRMGLLILLFIIIESVAGSAFLQGAGIMVMMLLGFVVRNMELKKKLISAEEEKGEEQI